MPAFQQMPAFLQVLGSRCWAAVSHSHLGSTAWERAGPRFLSGLAFTQADGHLTDMSLPASWYPAARAMRRHIIAHCGPTNSGKTHAALQALKQASSGLYCGPLRLLAWEVSERLNQASLPCNLITGQEKRELPGAQHTACTVEMAQVHKPVAVAVVDEIQMVAERSRGFSFTRALLGLAAAEVHVCGDPAVLPLLEQMVDDTGDRQHQKLAAGDTLEVRTYERLAPLRTSKRALQSLGHARRGDCVVSFSRREVHSVRHKTEAHGKHKCCLVYGALPPEARSQQALLFNTARTGYNVLSASNAVGMGLNLNIGRIIFTSLSKFDGESLRPLTPPEVKQIAGRAGRFGSTFKHGSVTCLNQEDLPQLKAALEVPNPILQQACLFPRFEQLALFASQRPQQGFAGALELFVEQCTMAKHFMLSEHQPMMRLALLLRHLPLSLHEAYMFCVSPTDPDDTPVASALLAMATAYCSRRHVGLGVLQNLRVAPASTEANLQQLEAAHRVLELYVWLAYRFEPAFSDIQAAAAQRRLCARYIELAIRLLGAGSDSAQGLLRAISEQHQAGQPLDSIPKTCTEAPSQRFISPFNQAQPLPQSAA